MPMTFEDAKQIADYLVMVVRHHKLLVALSCLTGFALGVFTH